MESPYYNDPTLPSDKYRNTTLHTIHVDGYGEQHSSTNSKYMKVQKNMYTEFNTYGLLWTENEYVFYINGYESWRTSFGVSQTINSLGQAKSQTTQVQQCPQTLS